jgi:opacity protein-like surface antigen
MKLFQILFLIFATAFYVGAASGASLTKPTWLTDCSLSVKESYDDNIFLSGASPTPAYNPALVPAGSAVAFKDVSSWITTVSPKVGCNFAPWLDTTNEIPLLSLTYAPDFVMYHNQSSESYNAHRLLAAAKAQTGPATANVENNFSFIDGSDVGPFYPGNYAYSAFAVTADRERREQIQDRANVSVQFDREHWFFRPTAALIFYDLMTEQFTNAGYINYADRYDVNGGADLGWKLTPQFALTLGYRYGVQFQEQYAATIDPKHYSASSDYQRVLLGMEGNPWKWLSVKIAMGPDFRNYDNNSASHTTPVNDLQPIKYYGEALITATLTPRDALTFKYKLWQWVSGTGKVPYFEGAYDLAYHRKLTSRLGLDLGGKILSWDYSGGNLATCRRNDLLFTLAGGLAYNLNPHVSFNLGYTFDWGRNAENNIANPQLREFDHQLVTLGTTWKF